MNQNNKTSLGDRTNKTLATLWLSIFLIFRLASILVFLGLISYAFFEFFINGVEFKNGPNIKIDKILHCLEILLLAPMPYLLVYAARDILLRGLRLESPHAQSIITFNEAKTHFISLLIGVISTNIMTMIFSMGSDYKFSMDNIMNLLFQLAFLLILSFCYKIISNHK